MEDRAGGLRQQRSLLPFALLVLALAGPAAAAQGGQRTQSREPAVPGALHGVWFRADEDPARCERYRSLSGRERAGDEGWMALIGALVVDAHRVHRFAEYGEGDFYEPTRVRRTGAGRWTVESCLAIDSLPDPALGCARATQTFVRDRATLVLTEDSQAAERWRFCSAVR